MDFILGVFGEKIGSHFIYDGRYFTQYLAFTHPNLIEVFILHSKDDSAKYRSVVRPV